MNRHSKTVYRLFKANSKGCMKFRRLSKLLRSCIVNFCKNKNRPVASEEDRKRFCGKWEIFIRRLFDPRAIKEFTEDEFLIIVSLLTKEGVEMHMSKLMEKEAR